MLTETDSRTTSVTVTKATFNFAGDGSEENPWLIQSDDDMAMLKRLVNGGESMKDKYFKMTADLALPANWTPIGRTKTGSADIDKGNNLNAFSGTLDGDNHKLTVPKGEKPLLGYVNGATVKNLKIYGEEINGYGLVNNFEGVDLSGSAIVIDNVKILEGTKTKKAGFLGGNITTNPFAGNSAGFTATIRNCEIEKGVTIGYDKDERMIGSFAGRMQGTIENCVSAADVYGADYVGGIIGFYDSLNKFDNIAVNFYTKDCGAADGIGMVKYVDTNNQKPTTKEGTIYFNTEKGISECPEVKGCNWKAAHHRTDDPLGADKENLTKAVDTIPTEAFCYELVLKSGNVKTEYYLGDEFSFGDAEFTAKMTDGTEKDVDTKDISVSGYKKNSHSVQTVTLSYGYAKKEIQIAVLKKPSSEAEKNEIKVSFTLLGDDKHAESETAHTLSGKRSDSGNNGLSWRI